jgi:hypothetical protein
VDKCRTGGRKFFLSLESHSAIRRVGNGTSAPQIFSFGGCLNVMDDLEDLGALTAGKVLPEWFTKHKIRIHKRWVFSGPFS